MSAASTTINQNNTYVQNPSFPTVYTGTATTFSYKVSKVASNICFLRLDFETFTITGPVDSKETGGGVCNTDTFKITGPTKERIPTICGKNAGQHMYVDFGTDLSDQVSLDFAFTGTSTVRTWEIKTSQIECSSNFRPPPGCLQYFTTLTGRITTFNFLDDATTHLASQDYNSCIKKQDGFCCVQYQVCADQTNAFTFDVTAATLGMSKVDDTCKASIDYVRIPGSSLSCTSQPGIAVNNKYCGNVFATLTDAGGINNQICDCDEPFYVGFHTDAVGENTGSATRSRGVCLDYSQLPCQTN